MPNVLCFIKNPANEGGIRKLLAVKLRQREIFSLEDPGDFIITSNPAKIATYLLPRTPQLLIIDTISAEVGREVEVFKAINPVLLIWDISKMVDPCSFEIVKDTKGVLEIIRQIKELSTKETLPT